MIFPETGDYCVIDDQAPANASINADVKSRKLLGSVNVGIGTPPGTDLRAFVAAQLLGQQGRSIGNELIKEPWNTPRNRARPTRR
jgi:hypothetical protein